MSRDELNARIVAEALAFARYELRLRVTKRGSDVAEKLAALAASPSATPASGPPSDVPPPSSASSVSSPSASAVDGELVRVLYEFLPTDDRQDVLPILVVRCPSTFFPRVLVLYKLQR